MASVTLLVVVDVVMRWFLYEGVPYTPGRVMVVSLGVVALTFIGGTIGGSLAYDYGFNVETSGDHPVWHESDSDVFPGDHSAPAGG